MAPYIMQAFVDVQEPIVIKTPLPIPTLKEVMEVVKPSSDEDIHTRGCSCSTF